jgi:hypothetical protein
MASNPWKTYKTAVEAFIQFRLIYKFGNIWPASVKYSEQQLQEKVLRM